MPPTPSVLLRHDLPDGSWHYDWLIDPIGKGGPEERNLIAFRVKVRPDEATEPFEAERMADHRRVYLAFDGALPGGERGSVLRIVEWACVVVLSAPTELHVELRNLGCGGGFKGRRVSEPLGPSGCSVWRFCRAPASSDHSLECCA